MKPTTEEPSAFLSEMDQEWIRIIEDWRHSGETIAEWVRKQDQFSYDQFMNARKRLFPEDIKRSEFVEQEITWSSVAVALPSSTIDLHLREYKLVIGSGFDQALLRELLEVLNDAD